VSAPATFVYSSTRSSSVTARAGRTASTTTPIAALEAYAWPGNVRELQNVIERACALAEGDAITSRDLPEHVRGGRRHIEVADAVAIPTETQIAGANDLGLKEAKERWMAVLEASYLRQLLDQTFHRLVTKHRIRS
jgi:DNA-binding NtrC family response regulator